MFPQGVATLVLTMFGITYISGSVLSATLTLRGHTYKPIGHFDTIAPLASISGLPDQKLGTRNRSGSPSRCPSSTSAGPRAGSRWGEDYKLPA